jgi:hypothetical protein
MAISNGFRRGLIFLAFTGAMGLFVVVVWLAAITQEAPGNLPVIASPSGPARVTPESPGGMQVPNQEMMVFETFHELSAETASIVVSHLAEADISQAEQGPRSNEEAVADDAHLAETTAQSESIEPEREQISDLNQNFFAAQLGSFGSSNGAHKGWKYLTGKYGDIMAGLSLVVKTADLGPVGTFYRLQTGILGGREQAEEFCQVLRKSDAECIVVRP